MTAIVRAELRRLGRRRPLTVALVVAVLFAALTTVVVFTASPATGRGSAEGGTTLRELALEGGGTQAFAVGVSFLGFLAFVTFIALVAGELSGGTFRALLLRQPNRLKVIGGKVVGTLVLAAGLLAVAELVSVALSLAMAPGQDVSTDAWFTVGSAADALADHGTALAGAAGWAVFGTTLAVIFRSAPIALGVGFAWAGPFENIVVDGWDTGFRVLPGQVLLAVVNGGTVERGFGRAAVTALLYTGVAAAVCATLLVRRDVTS